MILDYYYPKLLESNKVVFYNILQTFNIKHACTTKISNIIHKYSQ